MDSFSTDERVRLQVFPPDSVTHTSAILRGAGYSHSLFDSTTHRDTSFAEFWFEWGTTTSYGNASPVQHYADVAFHPLSYPLTGLEPYTNFHYRTVGRNLAGTAYSYDVPFLTVDNPVTISTEFSAGWNLVSVPTVLSPTPKEEIFPTVPTDAFAYSGSGYEARALLDHQKGYWLQFPSAATVVLQGDAHLGDRFELVPGWNLVGSVGVNAPVNGIISETPGVIISEFFGYNGSYVRSDTLQPGRAYWVKVDRSCELILASHPGSAVAGNHIRITQTSEVPPPPPDGAEGVRGLKPTVFAIHQNYPNPFNPITAIRFELPRSAIVSLKIFDVLGQEVATLIRNQLVNDGVHTVEFDASNLSSGVYLYRISADVLDNKDGTAADHFHSVRKMILLK